ncbi:hypothetical protein [Sphingomonas bacterium]|uniref:hypothetical protein n=1 Tax=Sphingomonas bacterium TaxID=1895847 RepID=UPI0015773112|nr:hypothetical protein [Sphingomonas bacterium]
MTTAPKPRRGRGAGRRSVKACLLALGAILLPGTSTPPDAPDPPSPAWQGVWQGTIGTLPVRACLKRDGVGDGMGSYYYLSRLRTIRLEQQGTGKVWTEGWSSSSGPPAPRWTFAQVGRDRLTGAWQDGGRTLAFRLSRVSGDDGEAPCGSEAFNGPRWRPLSIAETPASKDGVHYRRLVFGAGPAFPDLSMQGFALIGDDPATRRINAGLRAQVPGAREDWRGCIISGLEAHGVDGELTAALAPTLITRRWLGAALTQDDDCGGAHPNNAEMPVTFDRATGAAVRLHDWLTDAALDRREASADLPPTVRPAFRRLIVARAGDVEPECRDALLEENYWDIGLDRRGLTFRPELPHVVQACADDVLMPWPSLARFLTAAGRAGHASLSAR